MSLVISLTCALLATLLQQWARRYLKITQSRYSPHKRARIRAFFSEGVAKCLLPWAVDALPALLHVSLFLFFAGLVVFLCHINLTIFKLVLLWVGLCGALYGCITCMPIIRHDSPYYTPLSLPAWHIASGIPFLFYRFLRWFNNSLRLRYYAYCRFSDLEDCYRKSLAQGMQKTAEETALKSSSEIDTRAFMWTFDCLDEDHELERFFYGLPGFRSSKVVHDPLPSLTEKEMLKLYRALRGFLGRTFSSDLLSARIKDRRALICAKAVDPEHTPVDPDIQYTPTAFHILQVILSEYQHSGPVATGIAKILRGWENNDEDKIVEYAQLAISSVLAITQPRDDSWYNFASDELGCPKTSLREYATQGDSLSLVILIHFVRLQFTNFSKKSPPQRYAFSRVLSKISIFNAKDTLPQLQHEFCAIWNQIVNKAQSGNDRMVVFYILGQIRNVYLSLHQDTDSAPTKFSTSTSDWEDTLWRATSYPMCKVSDHIHDDGVSATLARAIPHDANYTTLVSSTTGPDSPPSSTHALLPVFTDALLLDNQISVPISTKVISQTATEGRRISAFSLSPVIEPSGTMQPSTFCHSPRSNASASQPVVIADGHTALSRADSDYLNVRSSPFPKPVLDAILPTGLLSFQAATRPYLLFVYSSNCR